MFKLNYKAKFKTAEQIGVILGPNMFGERFIVLGQSPYDAETRLTTLGLEIHRGE